MSRIRMAAMALVAVALAVAFAAAQASAALPEIGRCEPAASKNGNYKYKGCIIPANGTGAFEFHPEAGAKPKFDAVIGTPQLRTVGGKKIGCSTGGITGEWKGPKTATITTLAFEGCGTEKTKCGTTPSATTISNSNPLEGELGLIVGGGKPLVGLDIRAKSPTTESVLSFTCGTPVTEPPAEQWTIEGSVIGSIKPPDKMVSEYRVLYAAKNGVQQYEKFETGPKDVLEAKILNEETLNLTSETLGLTLKGPETSYSLLVGEEPLEIKAK